MHNPIKSVGMVYTPKSMEELEDRCESYAEGPERAAFAMGMLMTWNLASAVVDEAIAAELVK